MVQLSGLKNVQKFNILLVSTTKVLRTLAWSYHIQVLYCLLTSYKSLDIVYGMMVSKIRNDFSFDSMDVRDVYRTFVSYVSTKSVMRFKNLTQTETAWRLGHVKLYDRMQECSDNELYISLAQKQKQTICLMGCWFTYGIDNKSQLIKNFCLWLFLEKYHSFTIYKPDLSSIHE